VSSCRLVTWPRASAGQRSGTSGAKLGHADRTWAFSAAAGRWLRAHPAGQQSRARVENKPGQGQALTGLAHQLARAVDDRRTRAVAFETPTCFHRSGRGAGEPSASRDAERMRLRPGLCQTRTPGVVARLRAPRPFALSPARGLDTRSRACPYGAGRHRLAWAAPLPRLALTGPHSPLCLCVEADGMRAPRSVALAATPPSRLGTRRLSVERTSIRVWCRDVGALHTAMTTEHVAWG
jgi:hypothetical protein